MTPAWHDNDNTVREDDLQAYVDGLLDGRRRAAIEAYLAANPAEAARVAAYHAQNIGLHALFDPLPGLSANPSADDDGTALPPAMAALAGALDAQLHRPAAEPAAPPRRDFPRLAACIALLFTAGAAGWIALEQAGGRNAPLVALTRQTAEPLLQLAADPLGGGRQVGGQQVVAWLAAQPGGAPLRVPDLKALGFRLVAERLVKTAAGRPAAQLLYQNGDGQRVTLYMRAGGKAGQTGFTFARDGEAARFLWQDSHMAYSLIGKMAQQDLLRIAEAVSRSLRGRTEHLPAPETTAPPATLEPAVQPSAAGAGGQEAKGAKAPATLPAARIEKKQPLSVPERIEVPKET